MLSAIIDGGLAYPPSDEFFSPDEKFPEYLFSHIAEKPNTVYRAVRELFRQIGLDGKHYGTPKWNPLGQWISPGQSVFVLCNFVYHRRPGETPEQFQSKCTHGSVIRAVIDFVLIAVGPSGRVRFGNAPLQSCVWSQVLSDTGGEVVEAFYRMANVRVEAADLRLFVDECAGSLRSRHVERRGEDGGITVDMGKRSLLASLDAPGVKYRVSDYAPDRTDGFHRDKHHHYVLHRHILESDAVVSIPKMKTHEKVGITCAIKGCVGAIGHKDCLAHHRKGAAKDGGDEFRKDPLHLLTYASMLADLAQKVKPETAVGQAARFLIRSFRFLLRRIEPTINGAWPGNDTCWRMAVDIAWLVAHARADGMITAKLFRPHLVVLDGIVGGEGDGPLDPLPVQSGALLFSDNPVELDSAAAQLMGYSPSRLPMIREAALLEDLPLYDTKHTGVPPQGALHADAMTIVNGIEIPHNSLFQYAAKHYRSPKGWRGLLDCVQ